MDTASSGEHVPTKRGPMRHELKTISPFFQDVLEGRKTFELRRNDRDFRVGDTLWLREAQSHAGFTGRSVCKLVTYIVDADEELLPPSITGLMDGHVIMGLGPVTYRSASVWGDPVATEAMR